jgi:hypothetical protein
VLAVLPCASLALPAALRASARSASYASRTAVSSMRATIAAASMPSTPCSAASICSSSSNTIGVVNCANCRARKTACSRSGAVRRVATIARHARAVAAMRGRGCVANGIPKRRRNSLKRFAAPAGV